MRPKFEKIKSYKEFNKYYWYKEELQQICKELGIEYNGNKSELNNYVKEYFDGNIVKHQKKVSIKKTNNNLTLDTKLLEFGFAMRNEYRDFFGKQIGIKNFKYTADMAAALKKVRQTKDENFTVKNLIDVYLGKNDYAKYNNSSCQWNKFYQDFCNDSISMMFSNKIKAASILWKKVRDSDLEKIYSRNLYEKYKSELKSEQNR
ncbi:SAP domain-containing protein [Methanobrevibacter sp. TMH8]|uniref:SAP domain-containing protein n=1 Tax=Methanobrevibacter sp. TMH8 TaxID=2848611 RepID=UPI001CCF462A|nr:SAP domain-containing protein [Methanobrevibacter sp. TMH8]MBZ9570848.1 SAP domain-containing protein [Methanobrevibacter sp. TMH8]